MGYDKVLPHSYLLVVVKRSRSSCKSAPGVQFNIKPVSTDTSVMSTVLPDGIANAAALRKYQDKHRAQLQRPKRKRRGDASPGTFMALRNHPWRVMGRRRPSYRRKSARGFLCVPRSIVTRCGLTPTRYIMARYGLTFSDIPSSVRYINGPLCPANAHPYIRTGLYELTLEISESNSPNEPDILRGWLRLSSSNANCRIKSNDWCYIPYFVSCFVWMCI